MKKHSTPQVRHSSLPDIDIIDLDVTGFDSDIPNAQEAASVPEEDISDVTDLSDEYHSDKTLSENADESSYENNDDSSYENGDKSLYADDDKSLYENDGDSSYENDSESSHEDDSESLYEDDGESSYENDDKSLYENDGDSSYENDSESSHEDDSESLYENDGESLYENDGDSSYENDDESSYENDNDSLSKSTDDTAGEDSGKKSFFARINWHIVFAAVMLILIGLVIYRFKNFGTLIDLHSIEGNDGVEVYDSILPLIPQDGVELNVTEDDVTTIVAFGNAPFADDRDTEDSLASLIEQKSGATVYDCSVEGSYLAALAPTLDPEANPIDAFNFYWLTTLMCVDDQRVRDNYSRAFNSFWDQGMEIPAGAREAFDTLTSLDFSTVDVVVLMYDGSDYLAGHEMYNDDNPTDIVQFTGNMEAGIELIQQTYPHIRIIVMSPTYAYGIDDSGNYISSDLQRYGQDVLSTYVIRQFGSAYTRSVSFVDNLYGTITENNADDYLLDHIHLNLDGRKLVADRFVKALTYYDN